MIKYTVAMTVRVLCLVFGMMVQGWLMWVLFAGAIFLPYFAVVIANATGGSQTKTAKATQVVAPQLRIEATDFKIVDPEGK